MPAFIHPDTALAAPAAQPLGARALKRIQDQPPFGRCRGRLAAELFIGMACPTDARRIFDRLLEMNQAPWAKLGVTRAEMATNKLGAAHSASAVWLLHGEGKKSVNAIRRSGRVPGSLLLHGKAREEVAHASP